MEYVSLLLSIAPLPSSQPGSVTNLCSQVNTDLSPLTFISYKQKHTIFLT